MMRSTPSDFMRVDIRAEVQLGWGNTMPAAMPRKKRDAAAGQLADDQVIGRRAEGRFHDDFFLRFEAGHGVETTPAYDAYFCFQIVTSCE